MFGTPGALQRLGDVVRIVVAVGVAQLRQALRVALARDDGFDDGHAGHARDITHDLGEFEVHLLQGLWHVLNMVGGRGEEHLAVAQVAAQHAHLILGTESPGEQPIGVQALQPLAVEPIGFRATGGTLGLPGIDEEDLHPGGTATQCSASPMSMPAAWGWQIWRASESTGDGGNVGVGAGGPGSRQKSLGGVMAASSHRKQMQESRGGGSDRKTCSLPNGIRTGPVTNDVVANSRDQPNQRARSTNAGTVTTTHGRFTRIARNVWAGLVPSTCEAAQPPRPITILSNLRAP